MEQHNSNTPANTDNAAAFSAWLTDASRFADMLTGNLESAALLAIPLDGAPATRTAALLQFWQRFRFAPTAGPFAFGEPAKAGDLPRYGSASWGYSAYTGERLIDSLRSVLEQLHYRVQLSLAETLSADWTLSRDWFSTLRLPWKLNNRWNPTAAPVTVAKKDLPERHPLLDCLDESVMWQSHEGPTFVLMENAIIVGRDESGLYKGGVLPLLPVEHVRLCTLAASAPARDRAEQNRLLQEQHAREVADYQRAFKEKHAIALLEKELAEIKAKLEQREPAAAK